MYLRQSTAATITIGPFIDDTDFKTLETGLSIANTDIKLSKNGGASVNKNSGGAVHDVNGMYSMTLDVTDTNTVGRLLVTCSVSGALACPPVEYQVLEEAVFDALFASGATSPALESTVAALNDLSTADIDARLAAYDSPTKAEMDSAFTEIKGSTWSSTTDTLEAIRDRGDAAWLSGSGDSKEDIYAHFISGSNEDVFKADVSGLATSAALAVVDSIVDTILVDTNELQTDWTDGGRLDLILDGIVTQNNSNAVAIAVIDGIVDDILVDTTAIVADTNELQTDWADGGRLDLILDAKSTSVEVNAINVADTVVVAADGDFIKGRETDVVLTFLDSAGNELADPTFEVGDVEILDGTYGTTTNLPVVTPSGSGRAVLTLTASETNKDQISLRLIFDAASNHDPADTEWMPIYVEMKAQNTNVSATVQATTAPTYLLPTSRRSLPDGTIELYENETKTIWITPVDENGNSIDLTSTDVELIVDATDKTDLIVFADGSLTKEATRIGIPFTPTVTASAVDTRWALRDDTSREVYAKGRLVVTYEPEQDV